MLTHPFHPAHNSMLHIVVESGNSYNRRAINRVLGTVVQFYWNINALTDIWFRFQVDRYIS